MTVHIDLCNHRVIEWLELEGTFKDHLVPTPYPFSFLIFIVIIVVAICQVTWHVWKPTCEWIYITISRIYMAKPGLQNYLQF